MVRTKKKGRNKSKMQMQMQKKTPVTVEQLITQAEAAMDTCDCALAVKLYGMASEMIRQDYEKSDNEHDNDFALRLATILGRCGEAQVSLGDVENAKDSFTEAINVLDSIGYKTNDNIVSMEEEQGDLNSSLYSTDSQHIHEARGGFHLYLGQCNAGDEALEEYRKGVNELEKSLRCLEANLAKNGCSEDGLKVDNVENKKQEVTLMDLRKQICSAHCTIAELFLTDLCYHPDAESECEAALAIALEYDTMITDNLNSINPQEHCEKRPNNVVQYHHPDALQALANLRLSQSRSAEAAGIMIRAYKRIERGCVALSKLVGLGGDVLYDENLTQPDIEQACELENVEEATSLPSYEFRCQSAKLLLECGVILQQSIDGNIDNNECIVNVDNKTTTESHHCCEAAIQVLGSLLAENDEVIEIWYLLGCSFNALNNKEMARINWEHALEMLGKVKEGIETEDMSDDPDVDNDMEEQLEEIEAQMDDIQAKIQQLALADGMKEDIGLSGAMKTD